MIAFWSAVGIGALTALALFAAHYALAHLAPTFRAYPPRAYSIGVGILFGGYAVWGWVNGALVTVAALLALTLTAGLGTWAAYAWHARQDAARAARVQRDLEGE